MKGVEGSWGGLDSGKMRILLLLGAMGILLLVLPGFLHGGAPVPAKPAESTGEPASQDRLTAYEVGLARQIQESLQAVQGAGRVRVSLTLSRAPSLSLAENEDSRKSVTVQRDGSSQSQTTRESSDSGQVVLQGTDSGGVPVVVGESGPQVAGVLVVAEGARDPNIREELTDAVRTLLGIPAYEVRVLPMGRGR